MYNSAGVYYENYYYTSKLPDLSLKLNSEQLGFVEIITFVL